MPTVFFLEATLLRAAPLAGSFGDFAEAELLEWLRRRMTPVTIAPLKRYGPIAPSELWTYAPSPALGGEESLDNVVRLPAQAAMTIAGDIASALRAATPGSWPTGVQPWQDDRGRQRMRVQFDH